jgi:hypothetical protein
MVHAVSGTRSEGQSTEVSGVPHTNQAMAQVPASPLRSSLAISAGPSGPSGITMCVHAIYHGFYVGTRSEIQSYHPDLLLSSQCRRCRDSVSHVGRNQIA